MNKIKRFFICFGLTIVLGLILTFILTFVFNIRIGGVGYIILYFIIRKALFGEEIKREKNKSNSDTEQESEKDFEEALEDYDEDELF